MPQTYSLNAKQSLTIDAPIRNFEVQQGSVIVSKHDELIPTTVETDETFGCDDRGGIDFFSPDSATVSVLFAEEAKLAESGRHPGESEKRGRKRRRRRRRTKEKAEKDSNVEATVEEVRRAAEEHTPAEAKAAQERKAVEEKAAPKKPAAKRKRASKAKRKASRGDTGGGDSGGFESRTVPQLRKLAKKRKVDVPSKATKPQLIAALRKAR